MKYSFLFFIFIISIFLVLFFLKNEYFNKPVLEGDVELFIYENTSYDEFVIQLDSLFFNLNPIANYGLDFFLEKKRLKYWFRPGRYLLNKSFSVNDVVNKIRSRSQDPVFLTFNSMDDVVPIFGILDSKLKMDSIDLINHIESKRMLLDSLKLFFIPNTYELFWDISPSEFFNRMQLEYDHFWTTERINAAKANNLSKDDVFILASIVDKEASHYDEMDIIAGLYLNRLKHNWPLAADPTILYALQKEHGKTTRRVRNKHIQKTKHSSYNTYYSKGLPPLPICIPSFQALEAVLYPKKHNYMYMCARADNSEYHHFSITHAEHKKYANAFHRWLDRRKIY